MINFFLSHFALKNDDNHGYVNYYHFVVGTAPTEKKNPFSDRLLVSSIVPLIILFYIK
jgi:hypothetical protein